MKLEQERGKRVSRNQGKKSQGQNTERQSGKVSKNIREGSLSQNFITVQLLSSWLTTQSLSPKPKRESDYEQVLSGSLKIQLCRKHSYILYSVLETSAMTHTFNKKIPKTEISTKLASIQFIVPSVSRDAFKRQHSYVPTPRKAQELWIHITIHWCEHSPGPPSFIRRYPD